MSTSPNASRLFNASCLALIVTAMSFAIRGAAMGSWTEEFGLTNEQVGWINGTAFWGFTLAMVFGGPLCDAIGMRRIVGLAFVGHLAGILLTIFAWDYWSLFGGTLLFGIANGSVEAASNPLIAALYPDNKTTKLNNHVCPGGNCDRWTRGIPHGQTWFGMQVNLPRCCSPWPLTPSCLSDSPCRRPNAWRWAARRASCSSASGVLAVGGLHVVDAATELAQPVDPQHMENAGLGLLVLVWITGLMAVAVNCRSICSSPAAFGHVVGQAILSAAGLFLMSQTSGMLFASATVFAFGVFWPTMLGYTNERFPRLGHGIGWGMRHAA